MTVENQVSNDKKFCVNCGSTETRVKKNGREQWHRYRSEPAGWLCAKCGDKLIFNPLKVISGYRKRFDSKRLCKRMTFKNTRLRTHTIVRTGICSKCNKKIGDEYRHCRGHVAVVKYTVLHHLEYHEEDPLRDTEELCPSCHSKIHHPILNLHSDSR